METDIKTGDVAFSQDQHGEYLFIDHAVSGVKVA